MPRKSKLKQAGELIELYRAATNADAAFDQHAAARLGLSATDLNCVNIVERHGGVTAGELAEESGLTTGAVTAVIDRLENAGYARRVADPADRRKVLVEVTDGFYRRAREIWGPVADDWIATLSRRFSARELDTVAEFLRHAVDLTSRHTERVRR